MSASPESACFMCTRSTERALLLFENDLACAFYDGFPVNEGHILLIPRRHTEDYFTLTPDEVLAIHDLAHRCQAFLADAFSPDGFNVGWNVKAAGGQTVFHAHCHLIPRYAGDVERAHGGIRNIKPPIVPYP